MGCLFPIEGCCKAARSGWGRYGEGNRYGCVRRSRNMYGHCFPSPTLFSIARFFLVSFFSFFSQTAIPARRGGEVRYVVGLIRVLSFSFTTLQCQMFTAPSARICSRGIRTLKLRHIQRIEQRGIKVFDERHKLCFRPIASPNSRWVISRHQNVFEGLS